MRGKKQICEIPLALYIHFVYTINHCCIYTWSFCCRSYHRGLGASAIPQPSPLLNGTVTALKISSVLAKMTHCYNGCDSPDQRDIKG